MWVDTWMYFYAGRFVRFQMYSQYSFMDYIGGKENLLPLQIITAQID